MSPACRMPSNSRKILWPASLAGSLKCLRYQTSPLKVPGAPAAMANDLTKGVDVVEAVRQADGGPSRVVEAGRLRAGHVLADEFPVQVEIHFGARRWWWRIGCGLSRGFAGEPPEDQPYGGQQNGRGACRARARHASPLQGRGVRAGRPRGHPAARSWSSSSSQFELPSFAKHRLHILIGLRAVGEAH